MGDISSHVIFYSGYWYLVYEEKGSWIHSQDHIVVCAVGKEEAKKDLSEILKEQ